MTRKQLVSGLRALREDAEIYSIRINKRAPSIVIDYISPPNHRQGQLIITIPDNYATEQRLQTKPK